MSDEIYLGNPNLKRANVAQNFTQEQILEQHLLFLNWDYLSKFRQT